MGRTPMYAGAPALPLIDQIDAAGVIGSTH